MKNSFLRNELVTLFFQNLPEIRHGQWQGKDMQLKPLSSPHPHRTAPTSSRNSRSPGLHTAPATRKCETEAAAKGQPLTGPAARPALAVGGGHTWPELGRDLEPLLPPKTRIWREMTVLRGFGGSGEVICGSSGGMVSLRKAKEVMPDHTPRGEDSSVLPAESQNVRPLPELPSVISTSLFNLGHTRLP